MRLKISKEKGSAKYNFQLAFKSLKKRDLIISELFGCNVQISNIQYTGNIDAIGSFTYTSNEMCSGEFGLDRGVIMTTGIIDYAVGPNNNGDDGEE